MQPEIPERSLNAVDWDRLLHFVGYGRLKAPWWFVGLEEGVRDQTVENSLRAHAQFSNDVMDLGEAMRLSGFAEVPTNPTWRFVASIAASLLGTPDWDAYRAHRMGRLDGETLLAEILPLPAPRSSVWPEIYKQKWQTRREYEREVRPERIRLLETLVREKNLEAAGEIVHLPGRGVVMKDEEAESHKIIEQAFASAGLKVPALKDVLAGLKVDRVRAQKIVTLMLRDKVLVKVSEDLVFHRDALLDLRKCMSSEKAKSPKIDVPRFKEMTGVSRKYAIPLLEYLDREHVTRRVGDERVIL